MKYDVVVIGAGPAGLSFARALSETHLKVLVLEQQSESKVAKPAYDGREIALTHGSKSIMTALGQWTHLDEVHTILGAKVSSGRSPFSLDFSDEDTDQSCLGFMTSNQQIRKACHDALKDNDHVDVFYQQKVQSVKSNEHMAQVVLADSQTISCRMVVAADSRFSQSRQQMGIATEMEDFGRTCIVCTMKTELAHDHIAHEMFGYDKTVAILPLSAHEVSVVITVTSDKAAQYMDANPTELSTEIKAAVNHRLGHMTLSSERFSYPLVATLAKRFYGQRFALIGDAAVGMHPVTAHGFNLGLSSAWHLAQGIKTAVSKNQPCFSQPVLAQYNQGHRKKAVPIYLGTNWVVKCFTNNTPTSKLLRHGLLAFSDRFKPVSRLITRQLTQVEV